MARMLPLFFVLALLAPSTGAASFVDRVERGPHAVGFRADVIVDHGRSLGGDARRLQRMLWYPAAEASGAPLNVFDILVEGSKATSIARGDATDEVPSLEDTAALGLDDAHAIRQRAERLGRATLAYRDATPARGPFPVVLYMPAYNGTGAENALLFELLASHGYVVASVPSFSHDRAGMDSEWIGLITKVTDNRFLYATLHDLDFVDATQVAVAGFSHGGWSNILFALQDERVDAVISIDGQTAFREEHHNHGMREAFAPFNDPTFLRAELLEIRRADYYGTDAVRPNEYSLFQRTRFAPSAYLGLRGLSHGSFSSTNVYVDGSLRLDEDGTRVVDAGVEVVFEAVVAFVQSVFEGTDAFDRLAASIDARADDQVALTRRDAEDPIAIGEEFYDVLRDEGAAAARTHLVRATRDDPLALPWSSRSIFNVAFQERFLRGDVEGAVEVVELILTGDPTDQRALTLLGECLERLGRLEEAETAYMKALRLRPDHERTQRMLDSLRERL